MSRMVELYLHSPINLLGVVLNLLSKVTIYFLTFFNSSIGLEGLGKKRKISLRTVGVPANIQHARFPNWVVTA
jgi:hypothetical protein